MCLEYRRKENGYTVRAVTLNIILKSVWNVEKLDHWLEEKSKWEKATDKGVGKFWQKVLQKQWMSEWVSKWVSGKIVL